MECAEQVLASAQIHSRLAANARIHLRENGDRPLTAVLHGRRTELTNASVARLLLRYPLMPVQVIGLIHWQALRLWLKRVPFHRKPAFVPGQGSERA